MWLDSAECKYELEARATGTTVVGIRQAQLREVRVKLPPKKIVEHFSMLFTSLYEKVELNTLENDNLSALRDTLLPKLISGKLPIENAEKFLEQAGV